MKPSIPKRWSLRSSCNRRYLSILIHRLISWNLLLMIMISSCNRKVIKSFLISITRMSRIKENISMNLILTNSRSTSILIKTNCWNTRISLFLGRRISMIWTPVLKTPKRKKSKSEYLFWCLSTLSTIARCHVY